MKESREVPTYMYECTCLCRSGVVYYMYVGVRHLLIWCCFEARPANDTIGKVRCCTVRVMPSSCHQHKRCGCAV